MALNLSAFQQKSQPTITPSPTGFNNSGLNFSAFGIPFDEKKKKEKNVINNKPVIGLSPDLGMPKSSMQSSSMTVTDQSIEQAKGVIDSLNKTALLVKKALPESAKQLGEINHDPLNLKANLKNTISDAVNTLTQSFNAESKRSYELGQTLRNSKSTSEKVGKGLEAISGFANLMLSPISAVFNAANDIPVLGTLSKIISLPFSIAGEGATDISNFTVDKLVENKVISKDAGNKLKPGLGEISALSSQLLLGKATEIGSNKIKALESKYGKVDAKTIVEQATKIAEEKKTTANPQVNQDSKVFTPEELKTQLEGKNMGPVNEFTQVADKAQSEGKSVEIVKGEAPSSEYGTTHVNGEKVSVKLVDKVAKTPVEEPKIVKNFDKNGKEILPGEPVKKPSFNSAQSRAIQSNFVESLGKLKETANNEGEIVKGINELVSKTEILANGDKTVLAGVRTALNKEMYGLVGNSGDYKGDFKLLQSLKKESGIGDIITSLEGHIARIDENLMKPSEIIAAKPVEGKPLEPVGTGEVAKSKLAERMTKAMGKYSDIPEYSKAKNADQIKMATDYVGKSPEEAFKVAMGTENAPKGMLPAFTFEAVRLKAEDAGDITTLKALATKSNLTLQGTAAGQFVQSLSQVDPNSTVAKIKEVAQAKIEAFKKKTGKTVDQVKEKVIKQIKDATPKITKEDWTSFITSLECK